MRLTLKTSLGLHDLKRFGLDSGFEGQVIETEADKGEALIRLGWAHEAPSEETFPARRGPGRPPRTIES